MITPTVQSKLRLVLLQSHEFLFQQSKTEHHICVDVNKPSYHLIHVSFLAHQENFRYLNQGDSPYVDDVDDAECLDETRGAMDLLGISEDDQMMVFRILASILHLGNVEIQMSGEEESIIEVCLLLCIKTRICMCNCVSNTAKPLSPIAWCILRTQQEIICTSCQR